MSSKLLYMKKWNGIDSRDNIELIIEAFKIRLQHLFLN